MFQIHFCLPKIIKIEHGLTIDKIKRVHVFASQCNAFLRDRLGFIRCSLSGVFFALSIRRVIDTTIEMSEWHVGAVLRPVLTRPDGGGDCCLVGRIPAIRGAAHSDVGRTARAQLAHLRNSGSQRSTDRPTVLGQYAGGTIAIPRSWVTFASPSSTTPPHRSALLQKIVYLVINSDNGRSQAMMQCLLAVCQRWLLRKMCIDGSGRNFALYVEQQIE